MSGEGEKAVAVEGPLVNEVTEVTRKIEKLEKKIEDFESSKDDFTKRIYLNWQVQLTELRKKETLLLLAKTLVPREGR